jgi:hypothetical protein
MLAGVRECILRQAQASAKAFCGRLVCKAAGPRLPTYAGRRVRMHFAAGAGQRKSILRQAQASAKAFTVGLCAAARRP